MDERACDENVSRHFGKAAVYVAACRALATRLKEPWCCDPWAAALAGAEGELLIGELSALCPEMKPSEHVLVALLAGYLDAHVDRYTNGGFRQVVALRAGSTRGQRG